MQYVFPTMLHQASPGTRPPKVRPVDHGRQNKREQLEQSRPKHSGHRLRILELLQVTADGLTRHELAERLQLPLATVCGRVNELKKMGEVIEPGERRTTTGKSSATVVRAIVHEP